MPCGGCSLNETLCHALLQAGLNEDDVAARLGVDTKTVRRWIEGRALPYRRHRWALAALLSTAETDLWPQLRSAQPRPEELVTVYPHLGTVPREVWLRLFGSAQHEISLLDHRERPLAADRDVARALAEKIRAEITVRICLAESGDAEASPGGIRAHQPLTCTTHLSPTHLYTRAAMWRSGCTRGRPIASSTAPTISC